MVDNSFDKNPNSPVFNNVDVVKLPAKRRMIDQLPGVLQSQTLQNFFNATVDNLFQPVSQEKIIGFVGQKPSFFKPEKDFYVPEINKEREIYQLEPLSLAINPTDGSVTNAMFYADLLKSLRFQGGLINNQDRLFEQDYYAWNPPIDLDMLLNFTQYFWLEDGPQAVEVDGIVDEATLVKTKTNIENVLGKPFAPDDDPVFGKEGTVKLTSGMRIVLLDDENPDYNGLTLGIEGVGEVIFLTLVNSIETNSTPWDVFPWDTFEWDLTGTVLADYIIMDRGAADTNPWSNNNHWYHKDLLLEAGISILANLNKQASRPIISFKRDLELFNYGSCRRDSVDLFDDGTALLTGFEFFRPPDEETWSLISVDGQLRFLNENGGQSINKQVRDLLDSVDPNFEKVFVIRNGAKVLFTGLEDDDRNNIVYEIRFDNPTTAKITSAWDLKIWDASFWEEFDPETLSESSFIISGFLRFIPVEDSCDGTAGPTDTDLLKIRFGNQQGKEFHYVEKEGKWILAQQKLFINQSPLFQLYDAEPNGPVGINLEDDIRYPGSNFEGNQIFGFRENEDLRQPTDSVLGIRLKTTQFGDIEYQNYLVNIFPNNETETRYTFVNANNEKEDIIGYYFWKIRGREDFNSEDFYGNNWWRAPEASKQFISQSFTVAEEQKILFSQTFIGNGIQTNFNMFVFTPPEKFVRVITDGVNQKFTVVSNTIITDTAPSKDAIMIVYIYNNPKTNLVFELDQEPDPEITESPNLLVSIDGRAASEGIHFIQVNEIEFDENTPLNKVAIIQNVNPSTRDISASFNIEFKSFSKNTIENIDEIEGFFEVPLNLTSNPDWEDVGFISKDQFLQQFTSTIRLQKDFTGSEFDSNNWRDSPKTRNLSTNIVQHEAPLLRLMILNSSDDLDFMKAAQFVEREYTRFRNKFYIKLNKCFFRGEINEDITTQEALDIIFASINLGKVFKEFAFSFSRMAGGILFIPPTPSYLGLYPVFTPEKFFNDTTFNPANVLRLHDGSLFPAFDDFRDDVILKLEELILESIPDQFKQDSDGNDPIPVFEHAHFFPGKFRQNLTDYTREELVTITQPMFERWVAVNNKDYRTNKNFDHTNLFTFNYHTAIDRDGEPLPGYWRGIYRWYFDTDRPHTHPWEMLGFGQRPDWWTARYGPAPYTNGNAVLWNDIEAGRIAEGTREGIDLFYARPGLRSVLPIDEAGRILDPITAGIIPRRPNFNSAGADWVFGDGGPIESVWNQTDQYPFAVSQASYLMKPARFIEQTWNPTDDKIIYKEQDGRGQLIRKSTRNRHQHVDYIIHGEIFDILNDEITFNFGFQQWIVDRLLSQGKNITNLFGNVIRSLRVRLAYKVGGFSTSYSFFAENFGFVPEENVQQFLYRSPSIKESFYSGVVIERTGKGWKVWGYDVLNPVFPTIPGDDFGRKISHTVGGEFTRRPPRWITNTRYNAGDFVEDNNNFFQAIVDHISGDLFDPTFWNQTALPLEFDGLTAVQKLDPIFDKRTVNVPYGTEFPSFRETFDFLIAYQRYLEKAGWRFDEIDPLSNDIKDFLRAGKQFLNFAQTTPEKGTLFKLSPLENLVKFETDFGTVQNIEQIVNGVYSITDIDGFIIDPVETRVNRRDDIIEISSTDANTQIGATRVSVSEVEHIFIVDNFTIFDDLIYDPLYNQRQVRLKVSGVRSRGWVGRIDAPGFIVTSNRIYANFEQSAENFLQLFDIENPPADETLTKHARHLIGFQERSFFKNLLLSPTTQYQFFQGMLQAKGSSGAMTKLFRSEFVTESRDIKIFEEWAFRLGNYGATDIRPSLEFFLDSLNKKEIKEDPQLVRFFTKEKELLDPDEPSDLDDRFDNIITLNDYVDEDGVLQTPDNRWLRRPSDIRTAFLPRGLGPQEKDLPNAGPIKIGEFQYVIDDEDELLRLATTLRVDEGKDLVDGERVWFINTGAGDWNVFRITGITANSSTINTVAINNIIDQDADCGLDTTQIQIIPNQRIDLNSDHNLTCGDFFVVQAAESTELGQAEEILGTYKAEVGTKDSIIFYSTPTPISNTWEAGEGPVIFTYFPVRFDTLVDLEDVNPLTGWKAKDNTYIFEFEVKDLELDGGGDRKGTIKLIDGADIFGDTIIETSIEVVEPPPDSGDNTIIFGHDATRHSFGTFTNEQFVITEFVDSRPPGTNPVIVLSNNDTGNHYFEGVNQLGPLLIGVQISGTISNFVLDVSDVFSTILDEFSEVTNHLFSIGSLENPELFIKKTDVDLTVDGITTININQIITNRTDIYVFWNFKGVPEGALSFTIEVDNIFKLDSKETFTSELDFNLFYDFDDASLTAEGKFILKIRVEDENHDIVYIDDSRPQEDIDNEVGTKCWGTYTTGPMDKLVSTNSAVDFDPFEFSTQVLYADQSLMENKQFVQLEVDIAEPFDSLNTKSILSGTFDSSLTGDDEETDTSITDFTKTGQITTANVLAGKIASVKLNSTSPALNGIVTSITVTIADGGGFILATVPEWESETLYIEDTTSIEGSRICEGGVIYKVNPVVGDFTSSPISFEDDQLLDAPDDRWIRAPLEMSVGTLSDPNSIVPSLTADPINGIDLTKSDVFEFTPNTLLKAVPKEDIYVFFNFNTANINEDGTSAVTVSGVVSAFVEIGFLDAPGTYGLENILLIDEIKSKKIFTYSPKIKTRRTASGTVILNIDEVEVESIIINNGGLKYISPPIVTITGNGTGATALAILTDDIVTDIVITAVGTGYTTATVTFSDPPPIPDLKIGMVHFGSTGKINITLTLWNEDFTRVRKEQEKVNERQIESALLYNIRENRVIRYLSYHDPFKGVIPGVAGAEIYYKTVFDPAKYTHGSSAENLDPEQAWGKTQVGQLWWDLSTTRILDYEIETGDNIYRWKNWGSLVPGTEIEIYEWVRSPVSPLELVDGLGDNEILNIASFDGQLDGIPKDTDNPSWVERSEFDPSQQDFRRFFYFWLKDKRTVPDVPFRNVPAFDVAQIITDPSSQGIPWFAPVSENAMVLGGLQNQITNEDIVLQINWRIDDNDGNIHRQWRLQREGDPSDVVDDILWNKMSDSLIGWDNFHKTVILGDGTKEKIPAPKSVPNPALTRVEKLGTFVRPRQTWFKPEIDNSPSRLARQIWIEGFNELLRDRDTPFADEFVDFIEELNVSTPEPPERTKLTNTVELDNLFNDGSDILVRENALGFISSIIINVTDEFVGGNPTISIGTLAEPERFLAKLDVNLAISGSRAFLTKHKLEEPTNIRVFVNVGSASSGKLTASITTVEGNLAGWDHRVEPALGLTGIEQRDLLLINPGLSDEDRVLISEDSELDDFWSLWEFRQEDELEEGTFVLVDIQLYRVDTDREEFLKFVDWFIDNDDVTITEDDNPLFFFPTFIDMIVDTENWDEGSLVTVLDVGGRWASYIKDDDELSKWKQVARQKGTVELQSAFFDAGKTLFAPGFEEFEDFIITQDQIVNRDGSRELREIIKVLRAQTDDELILFQNLMFFKMIKFVHTEQPMVDWAFKTSFIFISGFNEEVQQKPVFERERIEDILDYINEVKPYHVKIREFIRSLRSTSDVAVFLVSDFDKPQSWDTAIPGQPNEGNFIVTHGNNPDFLDELNNFTGSAIGPFDETTTEDQIELQARRPWAEWWSIYQPTNDSIAAGGSFGDPEFDSAVEIYTEPVRKIKTTIVFDRIQTIIDPFKEEIGWDPSSLDDDPDLTITIIETVINEFGNLETVIHLITFNVDPTEGWDTDENAWDQRQQSRILMSGALERMLNFFPDALENWDQFKKLISGADFRGVVLEGGPLVSPSIIDFESNAWDIRSWNEGEWDGEPYTELDDTGNIPSGYAQAEFEAAPFGTGQQFIHRRRRIKRLELNFFDPPSVFVNANDVSVNAIAGTYISIAIDFSVYGPGTQITISGFGQEGNNLISAIVQGSTSNTLTIVPTDRTGMVDEVAGNEVTFVDATGEQLITDINVVAENIDVIVITEIIVEIPEAFNEPTIATIGTDRVRDRFASNIDLSIPGTFKIFLVDQVITEKDIKLFFDPGGSAQGHAFINVVISEEVQDGVVLTRLLLNAADFSESELFIIVPDAEGIITLLEFEVFEAFNGSYVMTLGTSSDNDILIENGDVDLGAISQQSFSPNFEINGPTGIVIFHNFRESFIGTVQITVTIKQVRRKLNPPGSLGPFYDTQIEGGRLIRPLTLDPVRVLFDETAPSILIKADVTGVLNLVSVRIMEAFDSSPTTFTIGTVTDPDLLFDSGVSGVNFFTLQETEFVVDDGIDEPGGIDISTMEDIYIFPNFVAGSQGDVIVTVTGRFFGTNIEADPNILVDGGRFLQPHVEQDHPEELSITSAADILSLSVYTTGTEGAPSVSMQRFFGNGTPGPFQIFNIAQSISGITIHRSGKLLTEGEDYAIDWETNRIFFTGVITGTDDWGKVISVPTTGEDYGELTDLTLDPTEFLTEEDYDLIIDAVSDGFGPTNTHLSDDFLITLFSTGGSRILEELQFEAPATFAFTSNTIENSVWAGVGIPKEAVLVTINGVIVDSFDIDTNDDVINIVPAPNPGDQVRIVLFESIIYSTVRNEEILITNVTSYPHIVPITFPPSTTKPESTSTIVYLNGYRLMPPDTEYFIGDGDENIFRVDAPNFTQNIQVSIDDVITTGFTLHPPRRPDTLVILETIITGTEYISNDNVDLAAIPVDDLAIDDSIWNLWTDLPADALWVRLNGRTLTNFVTEGRTVRFLNAEDQPTPADEIIVVLYNRFTQRLEIFREEDILVDFSVDTFELDVNFSSDTQVYVTVNDVNVNNWYMTSPFSAEPNRKLLAFDPAFGPVPTITDLVDVFVVSEELNIIAREVQLDTPPDEDQIIEIVIFENFDYLVNINGEIEIQERVNLATIATGTVVLDTGEVVSITINEEGSGYFNAPTVTIAGDGADAEAQAVLTNGVVTDVLIINGGAGYTAATVTFSGPPADSLEVITFTEDSSLGIRTEVFSGTLESEYELSQIPNSVQSIWATVDTFDHTNPEERTKGIQQYQTRDFEFNVRFLDAAPAIISEFAKFDFGFVIDPVEESENTGLITDGTITESVDAGGLFEPLEISGTIENEDRDPPVETAIINFGQPHARIFIVDDPWGSETGENPVDNSPIPEYTFENHPFDDGEFGMFFEPSSLGDPTTGPVAPIQPPEIVYDPGFDMQGWDGDIEVERDRVWITTFSGDPAKPPVAFRIFQDVQAKEEHTRIADRSKTIVNADFNFGDTEIELIPNPEIPLPSLPTAILATPTPETPGVIWIEGERIEYRELETNIVSGRPEFTLRQLRRGTMGTSAGRSIDYLRQPIIADGITREFDLPVELVAKDNLLVVDYTKIYDTPLNAEIPLIDRVPEIAPDETFTIFNDGGQDRIRFVSAPAESVDGATFMVLGYDDFTAFLGNTVQYPEGTKVINGSQKLPGGYSFDPSGAGIQFSNKPFAKFLVAGPGTQDK